MKSDSVRGVCSRNISAPLSAITRRGQQAQPRRAARPAHGQEHEQGARESEQMLQCDHPRENGSERWRAARAGTVGIRPREWDRPKFSIASPT